MDFSHNLSLPFLLPNQAQKHVTLNQSLLAVDALVQAKVLSRILSTPPAEPAEGEAYIPADGAEGAWDGKENNIAIFQDGAWAFYSPNPGWSVWCEADAAMLYFDGTDWKPLSHAIGDLSTLGINATADATNRLIVKSDAVLLDHDGADQRLKINKASASNTASLLFQSDFSGHAEMGLAGNTDFSIKVSPDGSTFSSALFARASDSYVGVGTESPASRLHITQDFDARLTIETLTAGAGGGFDILNSADDQNWRVTAQGGASALFKIRDHTHGLDKFELFAETDGDVRLRNIGNVGIDVLIPTTKLHVDGAVRVGQFTVGGLPSASTSGAGAVLYVSNASGGAVLAFSDGTNWRRSDTRAVVS